MANYSVYPRKWNGLARTASGAYTWVQIGAVGGALLRRMLDAPGTPPSNGSGSAIAIPLGFLCTIISQDTETGIAAVDDPSPPDWYNLDSITDDELYLVRVIDPNGTSTNPMATLASWSEKLTAP